MLSPDNSRMLAKKRQIALVKKDFEMIKIIENIKNNNEITKKIKEYK